MGSTSARGASKKAQLRQQQLMDKEEREEARRREQQRAYYEDDRLSLLDFYRMACTDASSPGLLPLTVLFTTGAFYFTVLGFELFELPLLFTLPGIGLMLGLLFTVTAVFAGPPLLKALRWRRAFRRLPFTLEGLGRLVHRGDGELRKFIRCSLRLQLKEQGASPDSAELVKTTRATLLQLAVDRANAVLPQAGRDSEPSGNIRWKIRGDKAEGYANSRVGGQILAVCSESFGPLQRELGLIQSVIIEPTDESHTFSVGG